MQRGVEWQPCQASIQPAPKQPLASRKASAKRRLSPADPMSSEGENQPKRKVTNPLLILVQSQVEGELGALEEQYNNLVRDSTTREGISRQDSDPSPTYDEVPADIFGSQESENLSFQQQEPDSLLDPSSSLTTFSSSYTSWTRPLAGHRVSDSCAPASSILDVAPSPMPPPPPPPRFTCPGDGAGRVEGARGIVRRTRAKTLMTLRTLTLTMTIVTKGRTKWKI